MSDPVNEIEPIGANNCIRLLEEDQKNTLSMYNSNQYSQIIHFYYVSDLHIDNKLFLKYPYPQEYGIKESEHYIEECVDRIIKRKTPELQYSEWPLKSNSLVLLCGDVAIKTDILQNFLKSFS